MSHNPRQVMIYHITDVENLPGIFSDGGLHSDAEMARRNPDVTVIGYSHIKQRRMQEIRVPCCNNRFVGEFVPFYFCPRSPMLYVINRGNTGRPTGSQSTIVHLVSTLDAGIRLGKPWAISDSNAGSSYPSFFPDLNGLNELDWAAIRATSWVGKQSQKAAEFLVADFFPWQAIHAIGCHNPEVARHVQGLLDSQPQKPTVTVKPDWYYL
jgi:hypothetical protein